VKVQFRPAYGGRGRYTVETSLWKQWQIYNLTQPMEGGAYIQLRPAYGRRGRYTLETCLWKEGRVYLRLASWNEGEIQFRPALW